MTEYSEDCCWNDIRDLCIGPQCACRCHKEKRVTRREWESIKIADFERLEAENRECRGDLVELQRRAIAVTRMWDALGRCQDELLPEDPGACGELQERLDMAIDGLMKLVDREMWDRRQAWMREAAEIALSQAQDSGEE